MKTILTGLVIGIFVQSALLAQEAPSMPVPQMEHAWLQQFVGEWDTTSEATMAPGQPAMKFTGTMNSRMLGGFWVVSETKNEIMGLTVSAIQTIGYDPQSKKYVGTFVDSMQSYLWKYQGSVDPTGKILTLEADGPDFTVPGKTRKYRDVYEFKSKNAILMSAMMQADDGKWITFMRGDFERKK
jgi:hypothetical protein